MESGESVEPRKWSRCAAVVGHFCNQSVAPECVGPHHICYRLDPPKSSWCYVMRQGYGSDRYEVGPAKLDDALKKPRCHRVWPFEWTLPLYERAVLARLGAAAASMRCLYHSLITCCSVHCWQWTRLYSLAMMRRHTTSQHWMSTRTTCCGCSASLELVDLSPRPKPPLFTLPLRVSCSSLLPHCVFIYLLGIYLVWCNDSIQTNHANAYNSTDRQAKIQWSLHYPLSDVSHKILHCDKQKRNKNRETVDHAEHNVKRLMYNSRLNKERQLK